MMPPLGAASGPTIPYVTFSRAYDRTPKPVTQSWPQLRDRLQRPMQRPQKDGPLWSPAVYREGTTRGNTNVVEVTAAVLDFDGNADMDELIGLSRGYTCLIHSTYSHTPAIPKYRVVLPLYCPVAASEWPQVWRQLNVFYSGKADPACKDAARIHYLPATSRDTRQWFAVEAFDGPLLSVADLRPLPPEPVSPPRAPYRPDRSQPFDVQRAQRILQREANKVRCEADGSKHQRLRDSTMTVAGLIPYGLLDELTVQQTMYDAIAGRAADARRALDTIQWAIRQGKLRPLPMTERNYAKCQK